MTVARPPRFLLAAALGCAALLFPAGRAAAQEEPAPSPARDGADRVERLRAARARWATLPTVEKERLRRAFEEWQGLPEARRAELKRRFEDLGGAEGARLVGRTLEDLRARSPERIARMRMQAATLERLVARLVNGAPERARAAFEALDPAERERVRRRLGRAVLEIGRDAMLRAHGTGEDRRALEGGTPEEKRAALRSLQKRISDAVLEPHREELSGMPEEERRAAKARYLEEAFWSGVRGRVEEIRGALGRVLQEAGREREREGSAARRGLLVVRDRFHRSFGVAPEALGGHRVVRALVQAASLVPEEEREAFFSRVGAELRRILALPEADRDAALRALLEGLRR